MIFIPMLLLLSAFCANKSGHECANKKGDTCFYVIKVPADLDLPSTLPFDTTIVRRAACKIHIVKLPSWGTETSYTLIAAGKPADNKKSQSGAIDITTLAAGTYNMSLMACGNGGSFTVKIK